MGRVTLKKKKIIKQFFFFFTKVQLFIHSNYFIAQLDILLTRINQKMRHRLLKFFMGPSTKPHLSAILRFSGYHGYGYAICILTHG